ncbi:MAG: sigma-54-dependent Fis family transcriptional regulator [Bacteroidetes bacterium]|nr:MAG: sigma-54-dependent Fis family transcriptional regulator [Bacteroidota bacterium]
MDKILYIDDEPNNLSVFDALLSDRFNVFVANNTIEGAQILAKEEIAVVITDHRMPDETGLDFIVRIQPEYPDVVFMILSGFADFDITIRAINSGYVYRFMQKPWMEQELIIDINNALERYKFLLQNKQLLVNLEVQNAELKQLKQLLEDENSYLKTEIKAVKNFDYIISEDEKMLEILQKIEQIAASDAPVLITGETGTGKELIARAVHDVSNRSSAPFICVNCAAIPEALFESELFGHEKGAFTGAIATKKGKFELAQKGTLFLDEIGELPLNMQVKLLRAIQEKSIERVGGSNSIKLDIRIITATNLNLELQVKDSKFRSDLFYRLNVFPIELPPLRKRRNDIPHLLNYFLNKYNAKYHSNINTIPNKIISELKLYDWPGNIRELENIVERAVITSTGNQLNIECLLPAIRDNNQNVSENMEDVERAHILQILERTSWKVSGSEGAAERLGMNRTTLLSRMKKLNISK